MAYVRSLAEKGTPSIRPLPEGRWALTRFLVTGNPDTFKEDLAPPYDHLDEGTLPDQGMVDLRLRTKAFDPRQDGILVCTYETLTTTFVRETPDEESYDENGRFVVTRNLIARANTEFTPNTGDAITYTDKDGDIIDLVLASILVTRNQGDTQVKLRYASHDSSPVFSRMTGRLIYPFASVGDSVTAQIEQTFRVAAGAYAPPVLGSVYDNDARFDPQPSVGTLYCTPDSLPEDIGGGMVEYVRTWSSIPADRTVPLGSYAYTFPGLSSGGLEGSPVTVTGITPDDGTLASIPFPVLDVPGHSFAVGDVLLVDLTYDDGRVYKTGTVVAFTAGTTITLNGLIQYYGSDGESDIGSFSTGTVRLLLVNREPETKVSTALEVWSYAMPGVTPGVTTVKDFREDEVFAPVDVLQARTDVLTSATTPTVEAYREFVREGEYIAVDSGVKPYLWIFLAKKTVVIRAK